MSARGAPQARSRTHPRLRIALILLTMVLSLFGARLVQVQGVDAATLATRAEAAGLVKLEIPAARGAIRDRNGVPLAESVDGLMIVADPTRTSRDAEAIARILTRRLGLDYFATLEKLRKGASEGNRFVYVARRVPSTKASAVMTELAERKYVGLTTANDPLRTYPAGDVAANLLGFMGEQRNNPDPEARGGLEKVFDDRLAGTDGQETYEVGGGNRIPLGESSLVAPVDGKDLELTIDRDVQWYTQRALRAAVQQAKGSSGAAVVMDTATGELVALADYPTFNPNQPAKASRGDLGARSLSDVYEPGSVSKVLTAAALIDAGKVTPQTRFVVPGKLPVLDRTIGDYFEHGTIRFTLAGVIARSSNIGTVLAAEQFRPDEMWAYLDRFGLGRRTQIGLAGETRGILPPARSWSDLSRATIAFGQGVSVNAVQMATAVNAIARGGELITPSLVRGRLTTAGGAEVGTDTATARRVVSAEAAEQTAQMMEVVTAPEVGTAPGAGVPGYRVAGKTGTAQQVGKDCKCYDGSLSVSFAGFAPADQPRFTAYVVIHDPKTGNAGGGATAGPVFRRILSYALQKYAVPPTQTPAPVLETRWGRGADR